MTPCLPTFSIAWAISSPILVSELAEIEPTCAIAFESSAGVDNSWICSTAARTALSIPRFRSIGFMPAATDFMPSTKIDCANTVAVVVPSPATSLVRLATSRTSCAPMFSNLFSSSISLATDTPSLVMVGAPNDLSITTLRPFGPSVTFTAFARTFTPSIICLRASMPNFTSFAMLNYSTIISMRMQ